MTRDRKGLLLIGNSKNGEPVYNRKVSHFPDFVLELLPEALSQLDLASVKNGEIVTLTHYFGRVIGQNICVVTNDDDEIVWAQRPGRKGLTRLVKNRQSEPTSNLTVALKKDDSESYYVALTAYIGGRSGLEPWDPRATEADRRFWDEHALIYEATQIIPGTETDSCPW